MSSKHRYRLATEADADFIADRLRAYDQEELRAGGHTDFRETLRLALRITDEPVVYLKEGVPVALFGVAAIAPGVGSPWLLGTTSLDEESRSLLTDARVIVHNMRKQYHSLYNYVYEGHTRSRKWIKWLGFTVDDPLPHGPNGELFCRFHWRH